MIRAEDWFPAFPPVPVNIVKNNASTTLASISDWYRPKTMEERLWSIRRPTSHVILPKNSFLIEVPKYDSAVSSSPPTPPYLSRSSVASNSSSRIMSVAVSTPTSFSSTSTTGAIKTLSLLSFLKTLSKSSSMLKTSSFVFDTFSTTSSGFASKRSNIVTYPTSFSLPTNWSTTNNLSRIENDFPSLDSISLKRPKKSTHAETVVPAGTVSASGLGRCSFHELSILLW
mmetsp:Transcript_6416/g.9138  ORF Transcript_6416/g.9138 Transcript_6416/m.9138 type:complete len:228 (-) Transcript_6416:340-1023(-)